MTEVHKRSLLVCIILTVELYYFIYLQLIASTFLLNFTY